MTIFRFQMAICSFKRLFVLQFVASWGVLWGPPLGFAIFLENGTSAKKRIWPKIWGRHFGKFGAQNLHFVIFGHFGLQDVHFLASTWPILIPDDHFRVQNHQI